MTLKELNEKLRDEQNDKVSVTFYADTFNWSGIIGSSGTV